MHKMTTSGAIDLGNGYKAMRTDNEDWFVSKKGRVIGYAPDLASAENLTRKDAGERKAKLDKVLNRDDD